MSQFDPAQLIPFNRASLTGKEFVYMARALERMHISGDGEFSRQCEGSLQSVLQVPRAMLTTSCTHALEMAALLLDVGPGDEVIVPAFTFVSTANAFALRGCRVVFCDIRSDTLNLDERKLEGIISPRTKAVVVVHYAGVGCEMDRIMGICNARGVAVVEDNAHGLFGKYRGKFLGTFGCVAALSFHETKNITCGEGGAILLNDSKFIERAEILREKGTNRSRFFRGQVDKYTWVDLGSSYLPSDLLGAFLLAQLESSRQIQAMRRSVWERYHRSLSTWAENNGVQRPMVPGCCEQAYHMYYLVMPSLASRDGLIQHLAEKHIQAVFHYIPLNGSDMGGKFGARLGDCPITESISARLLRLPFYNSLSESDQTRVTDTILSFQP